MTEDHSLSDSDGSVDVAEGYKLLLLAVAEDVVLLDGVQGLLLALQLDDVGVGDDPLGKVPHRLLESGREQQHLADLGQHPGEPHVTPIGDGSRINCTPFNFYYSIF